MSESNPFLVDTFAWPFRKSNTEPKSQSQTNDMDEFINKMKLFIRKESKISNGLI